MPGLDSAVPPGHRLPEPLTASLDVGRDPAGGGAVLHVVDELVDGLEVGAGAGLDDVEGGGASGEDVVAVAQLYHHLRERVRAAGDAADQVVDQVVLHRDDLVDRAIDGIDAADAHARLGPALAAFAQADGGGRRALHAGHHGHVFQVV